MATETGFFDGLGVVGWLGVLLWVAFILAIVFKPKWFFSYYDRVPKLNAFDEWMYTPERILGFMAVRFIAMVIIVIVVGKIMFLF
ncbi:hypothetical protein MOD96_02430 [Bacillus sp. S17B2]|uniref:hypothetical protein n=1 Tax=Bacillus sp. S17B2 TaxID=2918907 RepID=UPI00227E1591|nr:hypothetical protein [Bacillus sp. S17B2]